MTMPTRPSLHHIAVTVTDLESSTRWYGGVFGITARMDIPHQGGLGRLLTDDVWSLIIVLHGHDTNDGALFRETVAGLDHIGLRVPRRADLEAWQVHLESFGVQRCAVADKPQTQSPIANEVYGSVLVFRDPDNIQLELSSPKAL
jgi:glyoxylase I family protein